MSKAKRATAPQPEILPEPTPEIIAPPVDPNVYYTKPLETWTFRELQDALGTARTAALLDTTAGNVRMLRHRGTATLERMQALQAAVRLDEEACRNSLVTMYATGAFRRRAS